jgi:polysaccharide biosynthesis transport protein
MTPRLARAWGAAAGETVQSEWTTSTVARANLRRRRVFAVTLAAALAVTLSFTWLRPAEYRASARLEINPAVEAPPSRATAAGGALVVAAPNAESTRPFLTEVQVLTSRPVIELAVARLERAGERIAAGDGDPVAAMQSRIEAVPVSGTNVVDLFAVGPSPTALANLLNAIVDVYRERLAGAYRNASSEAMAQINDEVAKLEQAVGAKRRDVEAFRIRHNIISLERQENEALAQVRNLSTSLATANERAATAEGKLRALREALVDGKPSTQAKDDPTLAHLEMRAADMR